MLQYRKSITSMFLLQVALKSQGDYYTKLKYTEPWFNPTIQYQRCKINAINSSICLLFIYIILISSYASFLNEINLKNRCWSTYLRLAWCFHFEISTAKQSTLSPSWYRNENANTKRGSDSAKQSRSGNVNQLLGLVSEYGIEAIINRKLFVNIL